MGSGSFGPYINSGGGNRLYSDYYDVYPSELAKDKKDPDIYDSEKGYFKNPTATSLMSSIKDNTVYIQGLKAHGTFTYVLDKDGNIIFGKRYNPNNPSKRSPHPTLIGGKNPLVQCAGMITFSNGKIVSVDERSGHFRPNEKSLDKVNKIFDTLFESNPSLFSKKSKWRKKNE